MEARLLAVSPAGGAACCSRTWDSSAQPPRVCSGFWGWGLRMRIRPWPQQQQQPAAPGWARAYMEKPRSPVLDFFSKVQGALPVVGLITRIMSDEGGVGADRLHFVEFCSKVEKKLSRVEAQAFFAFAERHGKVAKPQYVLIWCWAAAVGAGLLRSEDLLLGAARLRVSYDIQYETETFDLLMDEAAKKRSKSKSPLPNVPMAARAEKALQAICKCCIGTDLLSEEDASLLNTILSGVFPTVATAEIEQLVKARLTQSSAESDSQQVDDGEVATTLSQ